MKILNLIIAVIMTVTASACNQDMQQPSKPKIFVNGSFDLSAGTNVKVPVITLSSGYDMPIVGLGTYSLHGDKCVNSILSAIRPSGREHLGL